jgi:hypothetical protein
MEEQPDLTTETIRYGRFLFMGLPENNGNPERFQLDASIQ